MTTQERIKNWKLHDSQRGWFGFELYKQMAENENIYLLTGDLGFGLFDNHIQDFPERVKSVGASEQAMLGVAVGLALKGKRVFVYTITSFFLRAAETISLYLMHEKIPVQLVGGGRNDDYKHDGQSHDAYHAQLFLRVPSIKNLYPLDKSEISTMVTYMAGTDQPSFISLRR